MRTIDYIDAVKAKHGMTDYRLAKVLGVTQVTIHRYRRKGDAMNDEIALRVAELLKEDAIKVLADVHVERAGTEELRAVWKRIAQKVATGFFLGAVSLSGINNNADARTINDLGARFDATGTANYPQY